MMDPKASTVDVAPSLVNASPSSAGVPRESAETTIESGSKRSVLAKFNSFAGSRLGILTTMAGLSFGALEGNADAALILDVSRDPSHRALGAAQDSVVFVEETYLGVKYYSTGILIRGVVSDWVVACAHQFTGPGGTTNFHDLIIGNGKNYLSDRGNTSTVSQMKINPLYNYNDSKADADLAFLQLSNRISPSNLYFQIATSFNFNDLAIIRDFGDPISVMQGPMPIDGFVRGVTALGSQSVPTNYNPDFYNSGRFQAFSGEPVQLQNLEGASSNKGSGGEVSNIFGQDYGMIVGGNSSATFFLDFNNQSVKDSIYETTQPAPLPEPATGIYGVLGLAVCVGHRRRARID